MPPLHAGGKVCSAGAAARDENDCFCCKFIVDFLWMIADVRVLDAGLKLDLSSGRNLARSLYLELFWDLGPEVRKFAEQAQRNVVDLVRVATSAPGLKWDRS